MTLISNNGHYHSDKLEDLAKELGKEFDVEKTFRTGNSDAADCSG